MIAPTTKSTQSRRSLARWSLVPIALLLAACHPSGTVTPPAPSVPFTPREYDNPPAASPAPSPTPTPKPRYDEDFERLAVGSTPADFVDVTSEEKTPEWVYAGNWKITQEATGRRALLHEDLRPQPAVSFLRYRGKALGTTNGQLPPVYYAEVDMRLIQNGPGNYAPTGDQGTPFYYLNHTTYLEVVIKPDLIEIWEANNAQPKTNNGWTRLWHKALVTRANDVRRIGALVDVPAGTFTAYLDGEALSTVKSPLLKAQPAWFTLRGIGNIVSFDRVTIEPR